MFEQRLVGNLELYHELGADVRYSNAHVPIRRLVTPYEPEVREVAEVLHNAPDFVTACQDFVHSFTTYAHEPGDYWATPAETLEIRAGDCDCLAILLCSLLRNFYPADKVFCAVGDWNVAGNSQGHMFVVLEDGGEERVLEATAAPERPLAGTYTCYAIFNDRYCFASDIGLVIFDLEPMLI